MELPTLSKQAEFTYFLPVYDREGWVAAAVITFDEEFMGRVLILRDTVLELEEKYKGIGTTITQTCCEADYYESDVVSGWMLGEEYDGTSGSYLNIPHGVSLSDQYVRMDWSDMLADDSGLRFEGCAKHDDCVIRTQGMITWDEVEEMFQLTKRNSEEYIKTLTEEEYIKTLTEEE